MGYIGLGTEGITVGPVVYASMAFSIYASTTNVNSTRIRRVQAFEIGSDKVMNKAKDNGDSPNIFKKTWSFKDDPIISDIAYAVVPARKQSKILEIEMLLLNYLLINNSNTTIRCHNSQKLH